MAKPKSRSQPTWTDVKAKRADFDRAALLGLIQSLYTAASVMVNYERIWARFARTQSFGFIDCARQK